MYGGSRVRELRVINGPCRLVHHNRLGGVTTGSAWLGLGVNFGNPHMETILICGVRITPNTIWDSAAKLKTGGVADYQELSKKDGRGDKESVSTGGFLPHKYLFSSIERPSVFTRTRQTRRNLGTKELGKAYDQPDQVMERMKNITPGQVGSHL